MQGKKAIVVGASGLVGGELLNLLLNSQEYSKVTVFGRRAVGFKHPKLDEKIINFEHLYQYKDSFGVDEVFCCLGTTIKKAKTKEAFKKVDVDYVLEIADMAKAMNVEKFLIVSSIGADSKSLIFYSRMKGLLEQRLKEIDFTALHIFRPSLLLGQRREVRSGESTAVFLSRALSFIFSGPLRRYKPIQAKAVAEGMYHAAQRTGSGTFLYLYNEIIHISSKIR